MTGINPTKDAIVVDDPDSREYRTIVYGRRPRGERRPGGGAAPYGEFTHGATRRQLGGSQNTAPREANRAAADKEFQDCMVDEAKHALKEEAVSFIRGSVGCALQGVGIATLVAGSVPAMFPPAAPYAPLIGGGLGGAYAGVCAGDEGRRAYLRYEASKAGAYDRCAEKIDGKPKDETKRHDVIFCQNQNSADREV